MDDIPVVMRVFLALCSRLWTEQQALMVLPDWHTLPDSDQECIALAALLTAQELMRLQSAEQLASMQVRAELPRLWDAHYHRPPAGGMPMWQELDTEQRSALSLIAQCLATECDCAVIHTGEA